MSHLQVCMNPSDSRRKLRAQVLQFGLYARDVETCTPSSCVSSGARTGVKAAEGFSPTKFVFWRPRNVTRQYSKLGSGPRTVRTFQVCAASSTQAPVPTRNENAICEFGERAAINRAKTDHTQGQVCAGASATRRNAQLSENAYTF